MDFSGGKTSSSTQANENSYVPTALGSNPYAAAEFSFPCTFLHPLGDPESCQKRPNLLLMTNLSEIEADSTISLEPAVEAIINVVIMNRGMFDVSYSRCRGKPHDKSCLSGD